MDTPKTQSEALKAGVTKYRTGKPCLRGHVADRWTLSGACCECNAERAAAMKASYREIRRRKEGEAF